MNSPPAAIGSQQAGITQPGAHLLDDPCTMTYSCGGGFILSQLFDAIVGQPDGSGTYFLNRIFEARLIFLKTDSSEKWGNSLVRAPPRNTEKG